MGILAKESLGCANGSFNGRSQKEGLAANLVDVKICSVDAKWSGIKFVYRVRDRGKTPKATGTRSHPLTE